MADLAALFAALAGAAGEKSHVQLGDQWTVDLMKELGRGSFGTVYKGRHKQNKGVVAVKRMKIPNDKVGAEAMKEIKNFQRLDTHQNIIYLYDFHYRDQCFWMIMEYCDGGDLNAYVKTKRSNEELQDVMIQSAAGLAHMHCMSVPIVHRDIKPANILIKNKDGHVIVKITDFGLSKMVDPETMVRTAMFTTVCGTPGYMAPELFKQVDYGPPVDVFALGLVYVALIYIEETGDLIPLSTQARKSHNVVPVGQEMCMRAQLSQPQPDLVEPHPRDDQAMTQLKNLIKQMTVYDPKKRHSMRVVEQEMAHIFNRSYVPREVKSGMPLFNRRAEEEEAPASANEGAAGGARSSDVDVAFQFLRDAAADKAVAHLGRLEDELKRGKERERMGGMNLLELLGALKDSDGSSDEKFDLGDRVRVKTDVSAAEAKRMMQDHGEWSDAMAKYFGAVGYVKQTSRTKVVVKFKDGETWIWNPALLEKYDGPEPSGVTTLTGRRAFVGGVFKPNDVVHTPQDREVLMCLQELIGMKWTDKMERCVDKTGIVHKIDRDGDVVVELINGLSGPFNPDALVHVEHGDKEIEAGDMVMVKEDRDEVKRLQEGHGGWNGSMASSLGKAGMVQRILKGDRALVEVGSRTWHFNVHALNMVAKGDELFAELRR